jgi:hypothetical protein
MRVCQFRHDGKWTYIAAATARPPNQEDLLLHSTDATPRVKRLRTTHAKALRQGERLHSQLAEIQAVGPFF